MPALAATKKLKNREVRDVMRSLSYLLLNVAFVSAAVLVLRLVKAKPQTTHRLVITAIVAYALMVVFNTYLTSLAIVRYDWQKVLGVKILSWPIEDLAYLVVALYAGPTLWSYFYKRYDSTPSKDNPAQPTASKPSRGRQRGGKNRSGARRIKAG